MEIVLNNVSYQKYIKDVSIDFHSGIIYGLTGKNSSFLFRIIGNDINDYKGDIVSDTKVKSVIISSFDDVFYTTTVKEEFEFIPRVNHCRNNNIKQEVIEIFYKLNLDESLYNRKINSLSKSERVLIKISLAIILDPNIIIFDHIFDGLDLKFRKKLKELLNKIKKDKIIIINDSDSNILYDITDYIYIVKNATIVLSGFTNDVYTNVEQLNKLKIEVPYLSDIAYKAKKNKNIKLFYRKDVRDTMKDIYRNV